MAPFPAIANKDFLAAASDEFLTRTISEGRPGRRMPAWNSAEGGLRPAEIKTLVAYLRELGEIPESSMLHSERLWGIGDATAGSQLFGRFCAGCHGANGEGIQAPALNNKAFLAAASDEYLVQTIGKGRRGTEMLGFSEGSPTRPALSEEDIESLIAFLRQWSAPANSTAGGR